MMARDEEEEWKSGEPILALARALARALVRALVRALAQPPVKAPALAPALTPALAPALAPVLALALASALELAQVLHHWTSSRILGFAVSRGTWHSCAPAAEQAMQTHPEFQAPLAIQFPSPGPQGMSDAPAACLDEGGHLGLAAHLGPALHTQIDQLDQVDAPCVAVAAAG